MEDLPDILKVSCLQWDIKLKNFKANLEAFDRLLAKALDEGSNLVVLPEMWSQCFCGSKLPEEARSLSERLEICAERARRNDIWIAAGTLPEPAPDGKVFNTFFLFDSKGRQRLSYRKVHLFPSTGEPKFFSIPKSDMVPRPVVSGKWVIGAGICFYLRFPELFRLQMKKGANLFIVPAQFPNPRLEHLTLLSRARALENLAYLITVNRCGATKELTFPGNSQILSPLGTVIAAMGDSEGCLTAQIDANTVEQIRRDFPYITSTPLLD
jgi:omega-amidase